MACTLSWRLSQQAGGRWRKFFFRESRFRDGTCYNKLDALGIPITRSSSGDLTSIAASPNHQGIAARVGAFPYVDFDVPLGRLAAPAGVVVILDEIQDPANLGNILRSSECLGANAVVLTKDRAVPVTGAVEKASAGASAHVPVARVVNLVRAMEQLKEVSYWLYAADARAEARLLFDGLDL